MHEFYIIKEPKKPKPLCPCKKELAAKILPSGTVVECGRCGRFWESRGAYRREGLWISAPVRRIWTRFKQCWDNW